jgi:MOSC domain-containing protein YiiM
MEGVVEKIFVTAQGGATMKTVEQVEAVVDGGLLGDRYQTRVGYYSGVDECEVTLIEGEALDDILRQTGIQVAQGEHRRNIVTRGIRLHDLMEKTFTIGGATFAYDRPRPPCHYVETITEPGMTRALAGGRGGICVRVVKAGLVRAGDPIQVV